MRKEIKMVYWHFMFMNKAVHEQVVTFNTILMNIFSNYIPNKYMVINDKELSWMTKTIKDKKNLYIYKSKNFIELHNLEFDISEMISIRKDEYHDNLSKKLNNLNTSVKTYWSILKSFYKGTKVLLIPPLLVNNKIVSDFSEKAKLFNNFFASQFIPTSNNSVLLSRKSFRANKRLYNSILMKIIFLK